MPRRSRRRLPSLDDSPALFSHMPVSLARLPREVAKTFHGHRSGGATSVVIWGVETVPQSRNERGGPITTGSGRPFGPARSWSGTMDRSGKIGAVLVSQNQFFHER